MHSIPDGSCANTKSNIDVNIDSNIKFEKDFDNIVDSNVDNNINNSKKIIDEGNSYALCSLNMNSCTLDVSILLMDRRVIVNSIYLFIHIVVKSRVFIQIK